MSGLQKDHGHKSDGKQGVEDFAKVSWKDNQKCHLPNSGSSRSPLRFSFKRMAMPSIRSPASDNAMDDRNARSDVGCARDMSQLRLEESSPSNGYRRTSLTELGSRLTSRSATSRNTFRRMSWSGFGSRNTTSSTRSYHQSFSRDDLTVASQKPSYFEMAKAGYTELVHAFIRPSRYDYSEEELGPSDFAFCGRQFIRTDFNLPTDRGLTLRCSHWEPVHRTADQIPAVIYMHGNSSARVEVLTVLSHLLRLGVSVVSFDFAGSGKSDGEYVSLGFYEREDLTAVISHLRSKPSVSTIALWGRSMGAATALMHGDRDPSIACMILDSPFADLTQLAEELVEQQREKGMVVPNFVVNILIQMIRASVKRRANFDIKQISPIQYANQCFIPALFVVAEGDNFIDKRHTELIHALYAGDKDLVIVQGDHDSSRPQVVIKRASTFLRMRLGIPMEWQLKPPPGANHLLAAPWFYPRSGIRY